MKTSSPKFSVLVQIAGFAMIAAGCGKSDLPPLGQVTGKITVDGVPLTGAIVSYIPEKGRIATGATDKSGNYEIVYLEGVKGCKVGPTTVGILTPSGSASHMIPAKYSTTPELKVVVKNGRNTFDFKVEADPNAKPKAKPASPSGGVVN